MKASSLATSARRRWERIATDHPELAPALDFQRSAWALLQEAPPLAAMPEEGAEAARSLFARGIPLLVAARPRFTGEPPLRLLAELARIAERALHPPHARAVRRAARRGEKAARAGLTGALLRDLPATWCAADELGVSREFFLTLCELAVSPSLQALAESAAAVLASAAWAHGYCPLCASWPVFAELRDADRNRYLRCGLCGADWSFSRMICPYCGESDHRKLRSLHVEGEAEYRRAELCESCKGSVKSLASLAPMEAAILPVEDLATAYLDLLALEEGYRRPEEPPAISSFGDVSSHGSISRRSSTARA